MLRLFTRGKTKIDSEIIELEDTKELKSVSDDSDQDKKFKSPEREIYEDDQVEKGESPDLDEMADYQARLKEKTDKQRRQNANQQEKREINEINQAIED